MSVFAVSDSNYEVTGEKSNSGDVNVGDVFIYNLTIETKGDWGTITANVSGDFTAVESSSVDFGAMGTSTKTLPIALRNTGSGDSLSFYITNDDNSKSIVYNTTVSDVISSSSGSSTPTNTDKYYPDFTLDFGEGIPKFFSGQQKEFTFTLKNISDYSSKNTTVKFEIGQELPFDTSNNSLVSTKISVSNKKSKDITFLVDTKASAKSGFYTIPVKITYQNVYGVENTMTKSFQVEVVNNEILPTLVLSELKIANDVLTPGQDNTILLNFKNLGTLDVKSLNVELTGLAMDKISLNADAPNKQISQIDSKATGFVTYNISISEKLKEDQEELTLKLSYYDENGTKYSQELPVYCDISQVGGDLYDYDFKITSKPNTVTPGDEFRINFDVTNTTALEQDLKVSLTSDANFIFKTQPIIIVKDMQPGETKSFSYTLLSDKSMTSNNYPIYANIAYNSDDSSVRKEYMGVFVDGDSSKNSKPKIIVDNYSFGKEVILAGETFELEMVFFNTSNTMGIQNAKVSISSDEGAFVPVNASSSFYIEKIGAKEQYTHVMTFKAKSDLNVKTYNVIADIEYEDSNGNSYDKSDKPYVANEKMGIPVMQELRLEVEDINAPPMAYTYQPFELYVEFFNMGKSPLQNTMVTTTGDFEVQDGKYFVGTFSAGSNDYYSCQIIPTVEGPQTGVITFEFEDAVGEKHSVSKEFSFDVMPMPEQDMGEFPPIDGGGEFPMDEEEKGFPWVLVITIVVIVVVIVVVIRKRIQKKKEMALDE